MVSVVRSYKVREVIRILESDGWFVVRQKGSHKQFKHSAKKGTVTVSDHPGDMKPEELRSIEKQAGIKFA